MLRRDNRNDLRTGLATLARPGLDRSDCLGYSLVLAVAGVGFVLAVMFSVF